LCDLYIKYLYRFIYRYYLW